MIEALQILTLLLVAITMGQALAHALEFPGKLRLDEREYRAVQKIYYPGFTIGGIAEPVSILATALLLALTPSGTVAFWLTLATLAALIVTHLLYWLLTHPVNGFWLEDFELKGAGKSFFGADPVRGSGKARPDWTVLRDRWERSHVARAALDVIAFILLAAAIAL